MKELKDCIDLESCIQYVLDHNLKNEEFFKWLAEEEDEAIPSVHHGFGTLLRNTMQLWYDGPPVKWFNENGIYHADDMSAIIIKAVHRKCNNISFDLDEEIKFYRDYWEKTDPKVNTGYYKKPLK